MQEGHDRGRVCVETVVVEVGWQARRRSWTTEAVF